jgi:glycosyltransferase involved in cell wall biosynthesis
MNVCYRGAVYNCSGYAQFRHLFLQLSRRGHSIKLEPYNSRDGVKLLYENELKELEKTELKKPYINIVSGIAPQLVIDPEAAYNIAHSMFETTELPERWISLYNNFNEIWVPSSFCKKSYNRKDLTCSVSVIPFGVDEALYKTDTKTDNDLFTFLSIGQWIDRKGWDILIQAYTSEFMGQYDVRLCIKTYNDKKTNEEMIREYLSNDVKNSTYMPRIMIKNQKVDERCMPMFYQEADCFVLPSRGEAFCLPCLESMVSGVPSIITDFGGQTDFVNDSNGWLIEVKQLKHLSDRLCKINAAFNNLWFAEPEVKDIRKLLRYVYENREELRQKGENARNQVLQNWTWERVTDQAEKRLNEIFKQL